MGSRWIPVHLTLLDPMHDLHPHTTGSPACEAFAWLDMIGMARWKDGGGLKRGQLRAAQSFLAMRWNWSRQRTQRFLADLEDRAMIRREHRAGRKPDILTICKYETYNESRVPRGQQANREHGGGSNIERDTRDLPSTHTDNQHLEPSVPSERPAADVASATDHDPFSEAMVNRRVQALVARWIEQYRERPSERDISKQGAAAQRIAEHHDDEQCARAVHGIVHLMPHSKGEPWDLFDLERKFAKAQASGQYIDGRTPSPEDPNVRFAEMYARALRL